MYVNGPLLFMAKGEKLHPRLRYKNLVTTYGFTERFFVIPNKVAYTDDKTSEKLVRVAAPGIRKMKVSNIACVFPILLSIYLTFHICPCKFSADDT